MASSSPFKLLQQTQLQLSSFTHCKCYSTVNNFEFRYPLENFPCAPAKYTLSNLPSLHVKAQVTATQLETNLPKDTGQEFLKSNVIRWWNDENGSGFSSFTSKDKRVGRKIFEEDFDATREEPMERRVILRDRNAKNGMNMKTRREMGSVVSSGRFVDRKSDRIRDRKMSFKEDRKKMDKRFEKVEKDQLEMGRREKGCKKSKDDSPVAMLRIGLDMCSKRGDVWGAIRLYDLARKQGIQMGQYNYAVLLYICSSAASGIIQPAKSGSGTRSLNPIDMPKENSNVGSGDLSKAGEMGKGDSSLYGEETVKDSSNGYKELNALTVNRLVELMKENPDLSTYEDDGDEKSGSEIQVSEDVKRLALQKGFEIYEAMRNEKVPMNEATFTSVARMATSLGDGDMAFDMVKQMKEYGINPRLRSYGPALSVFCGVGDVEKAFLVENHMLEHGVSPEEPELAALLKVSSETGKSDKVYYLLHKLRTKVRQVSPATADLVERWFKSNVATRVGKRKWDQGLITTAIENGGGGWHGQGWLGKGKWTISRTAVGSDGLCKCCGEKLVTIDLDPKETERFAESVASIAVQREKNSSFQKFQKWLDYYGPFEAVVDGANVGLYSQRRFKASKVNAVVNGIRQMIPSRKWPLIVLHNRRITGEKMDEPFNRALVEKWKNADALYATPTGSNDDWYWLYAAIKFRCLIVTNDEMRDHLFQLLGTDFFRKWKERHQVRFSFSETGPVFHMPPPCSVVIQESEKGHWHVPVASELESEEERTWLCITRSNTSLVSQDSSDVHGELYQSQCKKVNTKMGAQKKSRVKPKSTRQGDSEHSKQAHKELHRDFKNIVLAKQFYILPELEAAERHSGCQIDFQI